MILVNANGGSRKFQDQKLTSIILFLVGSAKVAEGCFCSVTNGIEECYPHGCKCTTLEYVSIDKPFMHHTFHPCNCSVGKWCIIAK